MKQGDRGGGPAALVLWWALLPQPVGASRLPTILADAGFAPPERVEVAPTEYGFKVRWTPLPRAAGYLVYFRAVHGGPLLRATGEPVPKTELPLPVLRGGEIYAFYVAAVARDGRASALSDPAFGKVGKVGTYVVVDRRALELSVCRQDAVLDRFPVGLGRTGTAGSSVTPPGEYVVVSRTLHPWFHWPDGRSTRPYRDDRTNPVGDVFIALDTKIRGRTIAIHGSNDEATIGDRVSGGCIRLRNDDARAVFRAVSVGTPVLILD